MTNIFPKLSRRAVFLIADLTHRNANFIKLKIFDIKPCLCYILNMTKKKYQHKNLAAGRWQSLSFFEQMANVGSEVERTIKWKEKGNAEYSWMALERGLELLDLTIGDAKNKTKLRELTRLREVLSDYFAFDNEYQSQDASLQKYFYAFNFAARNSC
jgi:hypothetical protein